MARESILVIEDEEDIQDLVRFHLAREGYQVRGVVTGEDALAAIKQHPWDLVLLDLMLPGIDGLSVARRIRSDSDTSAIPIIIISAKTEESDVVAGLEIGAVDYVTKPFSPRILVARVRSALRRRAAAIEQVDESVICCGEMVIDLRKHIVTAAGKPVDLTHAEFELLAFLASKPGWAFSRYQIVDAVRGFNHAVTDRSVDVQIVGLRRKLGSCRDCIQTVRGVGYRFRDIGRRAKGSHLEL
jgi:two-component system, OmpR family, alkaline phosphatase synthesis response regulator PhoP